MNPSLYQKRGEGGVLPQSPPGQWGLAGEEAFLCACSEEPLSFEIVMTTKCKYRSLFACLLAITLEDRMGAIVTLTLENSGREGCPRQL